MCASAAAHKNPGLYHAFSAEFWRKLLFDERIVASCHIESVDCDVADLLARA
jgi:hypothetical protein